MDIYRNKFTNTKLKKIVNVYQLDYTNGKSPGLGDFLRGSFCFMQLANILNIDFDIDISNHPISQFIQAKKTFPEIDYSKIEKYDQYNRSPDGKNNYEKVIENLNPDFMNKTIEWLNSQDCEVLGFFSNAFPIYNNYGTIGINKINSHLQPTPFMIKYLKDTLNILKLSPKGFGVIHIRTGDKYLVEKQRINLKFIKKIKNIINKLIIPQRRYIIISDCNNLKLHFKNNENFYFINKTIEHIGGEAINNSNNDGVMNTMLDYFLMSCSNAIISLSVYGHVSGFSKYCAVLNQIPFKYIQINE